MSQVSPEHNQGTVLAILCCGDGGAEEWAASVASLVAADVSVLLLTADVAAARTLFSHQAIRIEDWDLTRAVAHLLEERWLAGFFATAPVVVPEAPFERALAAIAADIRLASVSFFSNDANYLSFPQRNQPAGLVPSGYDERTLTRRLREIAVGQPIVPLPVPAGGAVLITALALRAVGGIDINAATPEVAVLDVALRAVRRGLRNVLDASTYLMRPQQPGRGLDALDDPAARTWLSQRHHFFPTLFDYEKQAQNTPLADSLALRKASVLGLRVLVDGACFGPYETGTQVAVLAQIDALANHPGVREVVVGTQHGEVPNYAAAVLGRRDVRVCAEAGGTFPDVTDVDIIHRPYQPSGPLPFERWHAISRRSVVTIQDLIAYDNGHYHVMPEDWLGYRSSMVDAVKQSDAIVAISHDTADAVRQARMPIDDAALHVIENGTDHLAPGSEPPLPPEPLLKGGLAAASFILVLGASYSHKNRDLAITAWQELRRRGHPVHLVLAGVVVPLGSTRNEEALASAGSDEMPIVLPDVTSSERDWLLEHASIVLYPTSAEGFGLVPFEAAIMGTPTLFVEFGPLAELLPDVPVRGSDWSAEDMADGMATLLSDPDVAREQVESILKVSRDLTWSRFASKLVDVYLNAMGRPAAR